MVLLRRSLFIAVLLPTLLLASGLAGLSAVAHGQTPSPRTKWLIAETEHFSVLSDSSQRDAERVARNLEALHSLLENIATEPRRGPKTRVFAFRSSRTFQLYNPFQGRTSVAGFFTSSILRNFIAIDLAKDQRGNTIYHELLHEFASTNFPGVPLWFNEGLAEYYSTFELVNNYAEVGRTIGRHLNWLRSSQLLPTEALLGVTTDSPEYSESKRSGTFYAQSWAAVHYLLSSDERALQLREFLAAMDRGEAVKPAFRQAFGGSFSAFDQALQRYVDGRTFQFSRIPMEASKVNVTVNAASRSEALARLGELLAAEEMSSQAREHLNEALLVANSESYGAGRTEATTGAAEARAMLGWLSWMEGDRAKARALFDEAVRDPTSVAPRLYRGMLELDLVLQEGRVGARTDEHPQALVAQRSLTEALQLEPEWPKAQVSLGLTYLYRGDPRQGIEVLQKATELRPSDPMAWFGIALLAAKAGDHERAWNLVEQLEGLLERLPQRSNRAAWDFVPMGRDTVAVFQINRAFDLLNAGEDREALEVASALKERLRGGELERFGENLRSVGIQVCSNQAVKEFNEIVMMAGPGRYREALERLDQLLKRDGVAGVGDGDLERQARELRRKLVKVVGG